MCECDQKWQICEKLLTFTVFFLGTSILRKGSKFSMMTQKLVSLVKLKSCKSHQLVISQSPDSIGVLTKLASEFAQPSIRKFV